MEFIHRWCDTPNKIPISEMKVKSRKIFMNEYDANSHENLYEVSILGKVWYPFNHKGFMHIGYVVGFTSMAFIENIHKLGVEI